MTEDKIIHKRYVAGSSTFVDFITSLGYEILTKKNQNLEAVFTYVKKAEFEKDNKYIEIKFSGLRLYQIVGGKTINHYEGFTVHDEIVKFFTSRNIK